MNLKKDENVSSKKQGTMERSECVCPYIIYVDDKGVLEFSNSTKTSDDFLYSSNNIKKFWVVDLNNTDSIVEALKDAKKFSISDVGSILEKYEKT